MYLDIAKLITDMEACFIQLVTLGMSIPSPRLEKFNTPFLQGYFNSELVDDAALNLHRFILLIESWEEMEEKMAEAPDIHKMIYDLAEIYIRNHFMHLIGRRANALMIGKGS